jgi:hypothetical protein
METSKEISPKRGSLFLPRNIVGQIQFHYFINQVNKAPVQKLS